MLKLFLTALPIDCQNCPDVGRYPRYQCSKWRINKSTMMKHIGLCDSVDRTGTEQTNRAARVVERVTPGMVIRHRFYIYVID